MVLAWPELSPQSVYRQEEEADHSASWQSQLCRERVSVGDLTAICCSKRRNDDKVLAARGRTFNERMPRLPRFHFAGAMKIGYEIEYGDLRSRNSSVWIWAALCPCCASPALLACSRLGAVLAATGGITNYHARIRVRELDWHL